ncbi:HD domain-containing protein [Christensenellaceae bacterium OttesenSCG-928-L17]|nr:HD domain-containing protein [Christensenellaceae bacterium OttesenSCG-928-L17]
MPVTPEIAEYIQENIVPKYAQFDKAHDLSHIRKVLQNSLSIAACYDVDINKVYVIAAYHDVGLSQGRDKHEKTSAAFLLADRKLKEWFSENDLTLMAEAVEDHRASNPLEPRSVYGKIISEADRDISYMTVLRRTILYGLHHCPNYTVEEHFERTYTHIQNKYGANGYLKLWLDTDMNRRNLQEIRGKLASPEKFRIDFETVFAQCAK